MVLAIWYRVLPMTLCLYHVTRAIRIDMSEMNLTTVPEDILTDVTHLILDRNNIIRITNTSLTLYQELSYLHLWKNGLTYIEDGSFDHNPKLKTLSAGMNQIKQLPHSFGAATTSLNMINFWCSLHDPAIHDMNFTEMISLEWLNTGCGNHHGRFDAAVLPPNLKYICLNRMRLTEFPYFARYSPHITTILIATNDITEIPSEYIVENSDLEELFSSSNGLSTIPDLYHLPLTKLHLRNNPFICDQSLCWIRMWPWMKTPNDITDNIRCETPAFLRGIKLMDINPTTLGCYYGVYYLQQTHWQLRKIKRWSIW